MKTIPATDLIAIIATCDLRDRLVIEMASRVGLRAMEVVALDVEDVCGRDGIRKVVVLKKYKGSATGRPDQEVVVPEGVRDLLARYVANLPRATGPLFTARRFNRASKRRLHPNEPRRILHRACDRAGVPRYKYHTCRHTAGTNLLRACGNLRIVQKQLRHADVRTTCQYTHPSMDDLIAAVG